MKKRLSDFHIHSTASDGSLSPEQILKEAKKLKIRHISITDHNSIGAYVDGRGKSTGIIEKAKKMGIELIPGVELTLNCDGRLMDFLAYGFDSLNPKMVKLVGKAKRLRDEYYFKVCGHLKKKGFKIDSENLKGERLSQRNIAVEVLSHQSNLLLLKKQRVKDYKSVFQHVFNPKSDLFVKPPFLPIQEALRELKRIGAYTSLAHPTIYFKNLSLAEKKKRIKKIAAKLKPLGLDALESGYGGYSQKEATMVDRLAKSMGLHRTRGSDFHNGASRPDKRYLLGGGPRRTKDLFARKLSKRVKKMRKPPVARRRTA